MPEPLKCKLAWGHLDFTQGEYAPCFRFKVNLQHIAKIDAKLPSEVINSDAMQAVRQSLIDGEFPVGCFDCKFKESRGLQSYRNLADGFDWIDPDNKIDYNSSITTRIDDLELKFSRTCNFLCRHCNVESNSSFEVLGKKQPEIRDQLLDLDFYHLVESDMVISEVSDEVIDDLIKNVIPGIGRIFFSGGEPLYHIQHYRFLERLIQDPNIDTSKISLGYNTNLSMIKFKQYSLVELWRHFKHIHVTVSLDGTGEFFNYFRERGNYNEIISNLYEICEHAHNLKNILLVSTSSAYQAFYADITFDELSRMAEDIKQRFKITVQTRPTFVHTLGLDMVELERETKDFIIDRLQASMPGRNAFYDKAIGEIITHLRGDSRIAKSNFKEIAKLQDELHNRDAFVSVPRIAEYVYNGRLI